jgi:hypothetical protein
VFNAGISAPGAKRPLLIVRRCHLWANLEEQEARTAARKRLDEALEAIRALCEPVEAPRDTAAHIRFFCVKDTADKAALKENEPKRLTLYKLAASLLRAYADVASEMTEAGYSDAEITAIKSEVDHFAKVRSEVKLASGDSIDLKMYEPAMRHLIDTYIRAVDSELISTFDDMSLVQLIVERGAVAIGVLPKGIGESKEAVAETIENNVRKLSSNGESRRQRNLEPPKSGIPKRKKIEACPRLSCKIEYLLSLNYSDASIASEFFTGD